MSAPVIAEITHKGQPSGNWMFFCPGCKCGHSIRTGPSTGPRWSFNGDLIAPTIEPSVLVTGSVTNAETGEDVHDMRCHSFVREGQIQFLSDCTHALAGQTVPLQPL